MPGAETNLYGCDASAIALRLEPLGARPFAGRQIAAWLYRRGARTFEEMTDIAAPLRARLSAEATIERPTIASRIASLDGTVRYLLALPGGDQVEAVAIPDRGRTTFCISSQVGCALACTYCMTGTLGLARHLGPGEIVGQVAALMEDWALEPNRFNTVFMGMGEPLHNYDALVGALRILTGSDGFAIGAKRITVSTAGMAPEIERLASERLRPRLAVSLSATTDEIRSRLVPVNRRYPIARLLEACRVWAKETGEQVFLEYVLLAGENDSPQDAARLARLAHGVAERINIIPFNETPHLPHRAASFEAMLRFRDAVATGGARVSVRRSRGRDIEGACGMLAFGKVAAQAAGADVQEGPAPPAPGGRALHRARLSGRSA
jgi:23S rRNA (adenine2503-C2)-methyltransferase